MDIWVNPESELNHICRTEGKAGKGSELVIKLWDSSTHI